MTLTMAQPADRNFTDVRDYSHAAPVLSPVVLAGQNDGRKKSEAEIKNDFPSAAPLEKQHQPHHDGLILFARKKPGSNRSMSVQAGYEPVWGNDSILRKISPDEQAPGFACVKASFNF